MRRMFARCPARVSGSRSPKLLTEIMGGEIVVQSKPGTGTTFSVRLLLSEATPGCASAGPATEDHGLLRAPSQRAAGGRRRIPSRHRRHPAPLAGIHRLRRAGWADRHQPRRAVPTRSRAARHFNARHDGLAGCERVAGDAGRLAHEDHLRLCERSRERSQRGIGGGRRARLRRFRR